MILILILPDATYNFVSLLWFISKNRVSDLKSFFRERSVGLIIYPQTQRPTMPKDDIIMKIKA